MLGWAAVGVKTFVSECEAERSVPGTGDRQFIHHHHCPVQWHHACLRGVSAFKQTDYGFRKLNFNGLKTIANGQDQRLGASAAGAVAG